MAIKKEKKNNKGISYDYWVAQINTNIQDKKTQVLMCPFVSETERQAGSQMCDGRIPIGMLDGIYNTGADVYAFAKKSNLTVWEEGLEKEGNPILEKDFVAVEQNWFADAEDC